MSTLVKGRGDSQLWTMLIKKNVISGIRKESPSNKPLAHSWEKGALPVMSGSCWAAVWPLVWPGVSLCLPLQNHLAKRDLYQREMQSQERRDPRLKFVGAQGSSGRGGAAEPWRTWLRGPAAAPAAPCPGSTPGDPPCPAAQTCLEFPGVSQSSRKELQRVGK